MCLQPGSAEFYAVGLRVNGKLAALAPLPAALGAKLSSNEGDQMLPKKGRARIELGTRRLA